MKPLKQLIIGTVLGAVVILGVAAAKPNEPKKYEYIEVSIGGLDNYKVFGADPEGIPKAPDSKTLAGMLNFYGDKGYEFVVERPQGSYSGFLFKKAK